MGSLFDPGTVEYKYKSGEISRWYWASKAVLCGGRRSVRGAQLRARSPTVQPLTSPHPKHRSHPDPLHTSYTTSWWSSRIRCKEDSALAAAYRLCHSDISGPRLWRCWQDTGSMPSGLGRERRPAGCSATHLQTSHMNARIHTFHPAMWVTAELTHVCV